MPALVSTRAADPTLTAGWREAAVVVDGSAEEWPSLERVGTGPVVGAQNDGTTLYLAVASNDATVRLQLATGLIVWLDNTAKKAQTFGVRVEGLTRRPLAGANPDPNAADVLNRDRALNRLEAFDLLGPVRNQRRLIEDASAVNIALASGVEDGTIVYEIALPLEKTAATPHAVGAKPGTTLSLGIETPTDPRGPRQRSRLDNPMNTNPWVNDPYGGYFSPPPPPGGGAPRPPKEVEIKPLKVIWTLVRLAADPAGR
jgi:hypothetical protein